MSVNTVPVDSNKLCGIPGVYYAWVDSTFVGPKTFMVRLDKPSEHQGPLYQCQWAAGIVSAMLGFNLNYLPPVGTRVLVLITGQEINYAIGAVAEGLIRPNLKDPAQRKSVTGAGEMDYAGSQIFTSATHADAQSFNASNSPVDLVEGELNLENAAGVGINLLRHLASLNAGGLAQVQCHLLDDMVRIISQTFRHYSAFGDFNIVNDAGKLNVVWHGTSLDHEAWGLSKDGDPRAAIKTGTDNTLEASGLQDDTDDGRWRFSQYIGHLGNFINLWVTDPVGALGKMAMGQMRAGKARIHINNDGSILAQSVADIVLEKVVAIPVPNPLRHEDDPQGDRADRSPPSLDPLKTWKPSDASNVFEMAFQLRDYARWLNNSYSLARFRQQTQDFEVPTEAATAQAQADINSRETDKSKINHGITNWRIGYACIRIYRDGSIQTLDAYGNSHTLTKTGIISSSVGDYTVEAAGSINMIAGRDINLVAQKNVNLSAVTEQLRLSAKAGLGFLVSAGHAVMEVAKDKWFKVLGQFNVNNQFAVKSNGNVFVDKSLYATGVYGTQEVVGQKVAAVLNNPALVDSNGDTAVGGYYLEQGLIATDTAPAVQVEFQFQTDYGAVVYESLTQQMLRQKDFTSSGKWNFGGNTIAGKGSPWPGNAKQKRHSGGDPLNQPSTKSSFTSSPAAMSDAVMEFQFQK